MTEPHILSPLVQTVLEWQGRMDSELAEPLAQDIIRFVSRAIGLGAAFEKCESAAERQFLMGVCYSQAVSVELVPGSAALKVTHLQSSLACVLIPQLELVDPVWICVTHAGMEDPCGCVPPTAVRIDFAIRGIGDVPFVAYAVEIDGHEFHEKTKDQAKADRQRERWIIRHPLAHIDAVIRFTGSEVFADPVRCADEALSQMFWKMGDRLLEIEAVRNDAVRSLRETAPIAEIQEAAE